MKTVRFALRQIVPLLSSYLFVGIAFGVLVSEAGYSAWWALFAALFIYAGSMQLILIPLLAAGAPLSAIALTTFLINVRHLFYGLGFVDRFRRMGWRYPYMALMLTDETYSVLCSSRYPEGVDERQADFYVMLFCHLLWAASCVAGALAGASLPFDLRGIEFSATAFFVTVCVDQWRRAGSRLPALAGLCCGLGALLLAGPERFLLPALSACVALLLALRGRIAPVGGEGGAADA